MEKFMLLPDGSIAQRYVVHSFSVNGIVDDPELHVGKYLYEWQQSESGKWIMEHALETPLWHKEFRYNTIEYAYVVVAKLKEKDYTYWSLKFK